MEQSTPQAAWTPSVVAGSKERRRAFGGWLGARGRLPLVGVAAALVIGLGTVAAALDTAAPPPAVQWLGSLDAPSRDRTLRLLHAAAVGLGAEMRRVEAERDGQLEALHDRLDALGRRPAAIATIAAIKDAAPGLHAEVMGLRLVAAGLLLREGARSGRPFAPALERYAMVAAAVQSPELDPAAVTLRVAALRPHAEAGVVSSADLRRSFAVLTAMVERAAAPGWWDRALVMVGLRDDPLQSLQDAKAALLVDDLEGAVAALAALHGEAALVTEGWLGLAQARLATDAAVDELYRLALAVGAEPVADMPVAWSGKAAPARSLPRPTAWQAAQTTPAAGAWPR